MESYVHSIEHSLAPELTSNSSFLGSGAQVWGPQKLKKAQHPVNLTV